LDRCPGGRCVFAALQRTGSLETKETLVTSRSRFNVVPPPARLRVPSLRRISARASTLAAPLLAAMLVASAARIDAPVRSSAQAPDPVDQRSTPLLHTPARVTAAARVDFDKIADVLAKRYRVSSQATLDLVQTAYREANRNGLDPLLILAVMAIESSFNPIAQSDGGAVGLMQIVPRYHEDKLGRRQESMLEPRVNIEIGTQVLREYIRRGGTEAAGLQLYNGSADDPATAYANKVMGERDRLRQAIKRADANRT